MTSMLAELQEQGVRTDGNCFSAAATALLTAPPGSVLVHGEVEHSEIPGLRFAHAWVEMPVDCNGHELLVAWDVSNGQETTAPQGLYYYAGKVTDAPGKLHRYTLPEVTRKMCETGHFGPWDLDIKI